MGTLQVELRPLAQSVHVTDSELKVSLLDGRTVTVPLVWYPALADASSEQLQNWTILGEGEGIHWPELDEDISVKGLLLGTH